MLCSNCSHHISPVVAIDIDGTLGDYHGHFIDFTRQYLQSDPLGTDTYDGTSPFNEWFQFIFETDYRTFTDIKLAYRQGGMKRSMPPYPHAGDVVDEIFNYNAEIWLTTTRPYLRYDRIDPDTRFWLDRVLGVEGMYAGLLFSDDKYKELADRIDTERLVAVLDDLPELCEAARDLFGDDVPILILNPYNTGIEYTSYARGSLLDVKTEVCGRVNSWYADKEEASIK